ncbi:c-type cytochrome [Halomonas garicola]|uniref:c-type cytochrome n=1 Tax=Halomonas garicola TaxID=1690008 RepID=UPI0028963E05|nr:cytochrome c [Halomonas garicola]
MRIMQHAALTAAVMLSTAALSGVAVADGDPEAGEGKVAACAACHGQTGMASADTYPNLAGQSATYLKSALTAYREGNREGGMSAVMEPQAASLSDEDIADIAAYYSEQTPDCASADDES